MEERPTNKYSPPKPDLETDAKTDATHPLYVTSQPQDHLSTERKPSHPQQKTKSTEGTLINYLEPISSKILLEFIKNEMCVDRVQVNEISIHISNFSESLEKFRAMFPNRVVVFKSDADKRDFLRSCRRLRSRAEGMVCQVIKVNSSYCSFFDKILYLFIKDFCDPDYMRGQINLQMKNGKFKTLSQKSNVSKVRLTKPIFLKPFKLGKSPMFR